MYKATRYGVDLGDTPRERFIDQFEWDGAAYFYRCNRTGPLYRLTEVDKNALVTAFDRNQRRITWLILTMYIGLGIVWLATFREAPNGQWLLWLNGINLAVVFVIRLLADHLLASRATLRALEHHTPLAPAMSRAERRRLAIERLPLAAVVGTATVTFVLLLYFALERPPIGSVGLAVIVASVAALVWAIVQGMRKWRFARADHVANNLI